MKLSYISESLNLTGSNLGMTNMNAIRWIFFDIGSTLVDEEEAYHHRIRDMIQGTSITFEQFSEKRIQYAKEGYNGDQKAIEQFGLSKTPWHSEDEVPFDDCEETLRALCDRGYQLGIIANQKLGAKDRLDAWELGRYLSVIASSAELGECPTPFCGRTKARLAPISFRILQAFLTDPRAPVTTN